MTEKFCINCKHFIPEDNGTRGLLPPPFPVFIPAKCTKSPRNLVDGSYDVPPPKMRSGGGLCGPDGALFKAKPIEMPPPRRSWFAFGCGRPE